MNYRAQRGVKIYLAATVVAQVCALVRYALLVRFLGPQQLGLAAALVLTGQFFDSISDSGGDRFLIQDPEGDTLDVQRLVHLSFVIRGILIALCLLIFAHPIALIFRVPSMATGFMLFALIPFISGFFHLDMRRVQRRHDFRTEGLSTIIGEIACLMATVAAAYFTHRYTAVIYGLTTRAIIFVIVSHLGSERRYELGYVKAHANRLMAFAIPLMLSGVIMFFGGQSDRILVSRTLGIAELGRYSAILLLVFYPTALAARNLGALFLPRVAAEKQSSSHDAENELASQSLLLALLMAVGFAITAPIAIPLLYGSRFVQPLLTIVMIGVMQISRFIRQWPTTVALAIGKSNDVLVPNIVRLVGYPLAIVVVMSGGSIAGIVAGLALGELVALATGLVLINRSMKRSLLHNFDRMASFVFGCILLVVWTQVPGHGIAPWVGLTTATVGFSGYVYAKERPTIATCIRRGLQLVRLN